MDQEITYGNTQIVLWLSSFMLCTLYLGKFFVQKYRFFKNASRIPSCRTGSILGIAGDFGGKSIEDCSKHVLGYFETSAEVFKGWLGPMLLVGISKPEHMEIILTNSSCFNRSPLINFTKQFLGDGLFTVSANIWKKNRKLINPTFNLQVLHSYIPIFEEKCDILIGILEKNVGKPDINIMGMISRCTVDTVCEASMGQKMDTQTSNGRYAKILDDVLEIATTRMCNVFYHPEMIFNLTKIGKKFRKLTEEINDLSRQVITQRRAEFEQKLKGAYVEGENGRRKTFLDNLLETSQNDGHFTNKQIQDEVNTFIAAGSDTSATTLSFCCTMMGLFPEYQEKLYEEAIEVLGADRYATKDDLPNLAFTEMFIKETLRIFTIGPLLVKVASDDIKIDDMVIPKGATIVLNVLHMHRSPKYWEDPLKFNPYRFLPEEISKKHAYSFLPFSGGPRNCIGSKYAMIIMKLIISKIVRKFKIKTDYKSIEDVELKINSLLRPCHGFKVSLEPRE